MTSEKLTCKELKRRYLSGETTPQKIVNEIIERSSELEHMNIWIVKPDQKKIAKYLENLGAMDFEKKPLWGIPFAIKDNIDLEANETTAACPAYAYMAEKSATVVQRLIEAGAIPIGKTNMDQFATGLVGTRSPYGEVHNALQEELISGGSSAGSAVAVAKGLAAFALGTDTAGSGRVPAALNNLVGYKPSVGAWSNKGVVPACASLDCVTVFTNTIEDAKKVDQIARGFDKEDKWSKKILHKTSAMPSKIYIPDTEPEFYGRFADSYKKGWESSICKLQELNVKVERIDTSFYQEAALLLYGGPCVAERWSDLGTFVTEHKDDIFPVTRTILESGNRPDYTADYLYQVQHRLAEYKRRSNNILEDAVLVFPTCAGTYERDIVRENPIDTNSNMGKYTNHCNLLDMCAVAIPTAMPEENLPFGVTLFSTSENEHLICGVAEALEK